MDIYVSITVPGDWGESVCKISARTILSALHLSRHNYYTDYVETRFIGRQPFIFTFGIFADGYGAVTHLNYAPRSIPCFITM